MVEDYSRSLGMAVPARQRRSYVCGTQQLPPISRRVIDMFREIDVPSVYGHYSAFSHGDVSALQQGFQETRAPDGHRFYRPVIDEDTIKGAVAAASWALYPPAYRATTLLGLGQSNLKDQVEDQSAVPRLQERRSTPEDSK